MVRVAMAFALYKKGHVTYLGRLIDFIDSDSWPRRSRDTSWSSDRLSSPWPSSGLQEPDADARRNLVRFSVRSAISPP